MSDLDALIRDLERLPDEVRGEIEPIFEKTALQVKNRMQADFQGSTHFHQVGRTIDYETRQAGDGFEAEIGPNRDRGGAAALAGIAYFGGVNGGGGTIPEPDSIAEDEADIMARFITNAAGAIL